jgi:hypothetical protein
MKRGCEWCCDRFLEATRKNSHAVARTKQEGKAEDTHETRCREKRRRSELENRNRREGIEKSKRMTTRMVVEAKIQDKVGER